MANVIKHKRGSGSDPAANNLVIGELAIRTDNGKLFTKMDSGAIAEIAGGGSDIAINTLSSSSATGGGSATFNGSAYRFTLSSPPSVSAAQLLVSVNGVVQKPVAGTGQPSEGFSVDGNDIIFGDAPATGSDFFILTFRSLGVSEPADNSVTSAKIVDGAIVNADINASAAIAGSKITPNFTSNLEITANSPSIKFNESDSNPDYQIKTQTGVFKIKQQGGSDQLSIAADGTVDVAGNLDVGAGIDVTGAITGTGDLTIDTNTLHVDSSNNRVGIGITNPERLLHVVGSDCRIKLSDSDVSADVELQNNSGNGVLTTNGATNLIFMNNNTERMRVDSSGRVLVGGTDASVVHTNADDVVIGNTSASVAGLSIATSTSGYATLQFSDGAGNKNQGQIAYNHADNSLAFTTDSSVRMKVDSSGDTEINSENDKGLFVKTDGNNAAVRLRATGGSDSGGFRLNHNAPNSLLLFDRISSNGVFASTLMALNSSGNLGINQTNPNKARLHVVGDNTSDDIIAKFKSGAGSANESVFIALVSGYSDTANDFEGHAYIGCTRSGSGNQSKIIFKTYSGDSGGAMRTRMTIEPNNNIDIQGKIHTQLGTQINSFNKETTGDQIRFNTTGTTRGSISSNGSTVAFNTSASDRSMKKNFENWTEDTLNLFKNINPQKFNFLDQEDGTNKEKGFIAQDMVASFPEAYIKNDDDKYMFNASGMVVYLMKALQEAVARIEVLEAK